MPTGPFGSPSAWALIDGYDLFATARVKGFESEILSVNEETTGLGMAYKDTTPVGVVEVMVKQTGGLFDTATNGGHAANKTLASSPAATPRVLCFGFAGQTVNYPFTGIRGAFSNKYVVQAEGKQLTKANGEWAINGPQERGLIVQPLATKTADWNTDTLNTEADYTLDSTQLVIPITSNSAANPSVITTPVPHGMTSGDIVLIAGVAGSSADINGERTVTVISTMTFSVPVDATGSGGTGGTFVKANSTGGGVGYLQVTAASGFTNFVGKLRDSPDNSTFTDWAVFADNVMAPFAERVEVSGTVDRYITFVGDVTGTGSITVFAGAVRNNQ